MTTPYDDQGHGDWDALAVAWALSALDPEDEARFADHLPGCARCTSTVQESLHTVADLAYALPEETPPRRLRRRIMNSVAAASREAPVRPPAEGIPDDLRAELRDGPGADLADHRYAGRPEDPHAGAVDDPYAGRPQDPYAGAVDDPYADRPQDPYAGRPEDPHARRIDDPYADRPEDPHPQRIDDPYAGRPQDPYAGRAEDPYADRRDGAEPGGGGRIDWSVGVPAPAPLAGGASVVPLEPRRRSWVRRAAVAAAVALIAALGAWNVKLHSDQDRLRDVVAQRDALVTRLTEPGPADIAVIRQGPGGTGERQATVVVKDGRVGLITETLNPQPAGRAYWLWSLSGPGDADPVPLASFPVPETRLSACNIEPPAGVDVTRAFAISEEPATAKPRTPSNVVAYGATDQQ